jgi:hypothetical protein
MKIGGASFSGMQPAASARSEGAGKSAPPAPLLFGQGQLVRGEVTGLTPDGKVLLDIGGQIVEAKSEILLKPGSVFWFEVQETEPLWLRVADKKGAAQEFLRQYCADPAAMGKGLRFLLDLASLLDTEKGLPEQAGILRNLAGVAIGPEADPARIIRLLTMLGEADRGSGQAGEGVKKLLPLATLLAEDREGLIGKTGAATLQKLGLLLELQAELNTLPATSRQAQFHLFPCLFAMGGGVGQWLFTLDRGEDRAGTGEDRGYALSFFLEMSRLGELQIQIRVKGQALQGEFLVNGDPVREYLAPQLVELEELLGKLGYGPVHFSCRVAKTSMLESLKSGIETAAQLERVRIVDLEA